MIAKTICIALLAATALRATEPTQLSGIYPSLAMFNDEGECGTGSVVPWADRLWVVTYAPHSPKGSSDKLYEITPDLQQIVRPESIGGTPANRMIHDESKQLFIGPYAISADRDVRVIPFANMFGRSTGNARSLTDPAGKILGATMEEGIYEIDVKSLAVTELWGDEQVKNSPRKANLPGYHGKGFYSGQGVYVYANNGEHGKAALEHPETPSGVLAEWDGKSDAWKIIRRNQFTEVTGPGGIHGSAHPDTDPIWALGWDFRSLLLGVRRPGTGWTFHRLPKASHSYDGAHGWNTEWPRIREIGEDDLLMTMHGSFWKFPKDFGVADSAGISPHSNYLKVIGDFSRWNDKLVMGCDDTAKNEFLNKRKAKGGIAAPQSQSNLWFIQPETLDQLGPAIGRGSVWSKEAVRSGVASDPYLFSGYDHRALHLSQDSGQAVTFQMEVDRDGTDRWTPLRDVVVPASGYAFVEFPASEAGAWIRLTARADVPHASAVFTYRNRDGRSAKAASIFDGVAKLGEPLSRGIVQARDENKRTLSFESIAAGATEPTYYELDADLKLRPASAATAPKHSTIPSGMLVSDAASVLFTDDDGKRWRLPKSRLETPAKPAIDARLLREVATERDLLNAAGTFYELPANNAGGFSKIRPVSTHNRDIRDFCSYRGLFILSGVSTNAPTTNPHILRSSDGKVALWAGAIDDIWKLGKPVGVGGPWKDDAVRKGKPSDPYLMTAYDQKSLRLQADRNTTITAEIDLTGSGEWVAYRSFEVVAGKAVAHTFPDAFSAYWIRFTADQDCTASAILDYQ